MATYRQIHISFWQDGFVLGLTPEEKYFYLYLMTNSKTTQCGIYELPKRVIEMETGYNRETVDKLLSRFINDYQKIQYCDATQEVMIMKWMKHNRINSQAVKQCIKKELGDVKYKPFIQAFFELCKLLQYPIETVCTPSIYGLDRLPIDSGEEEEKEEEKEKEEEVPSLSQNGHEDRITKWFNEYKLGGGLDGLQDLFHFIGKVDLLVIEKAMRKSNGKHSNYCCKILNDWVKEGKTRIEQFQVIDFNQDKNNGRTAAQLAIDREIAYNAALNKWMDEGKDPNDFVFNPSA